MNSFLHQAAHRASNDCLAFHEMSARQRTARISYGKGCRLLVYMKSVAGRTYTALWIRVRTWVRIMGLGSIRRASG